MKVNVTQLRRTEGVTGTFFFREDAPPIQLGSEEYVFLKPLEVKLEVTNTGKSLVVRGQVNSELDVNCSRCLKAFPYPLEFSFEDEWRPVEFAAEDEEDNSLLFEKDEFEITERINEHILLQMPMKFQCSKNCQGLCPRCGADRNLNPCACSDENIDPRLEILSKWNKGV